jgi:hypothetical protein
MRKNRRKIGQGVANTTLSLSLEAKQKLDELSFIYNLSRSAIVDRMLKDISPRLLAIEFNWKPESHSEG